LGALGEKFKEVTVSVLPITILVTILHFTFTPLPLLMFWRFIIGAVTIIIGLAIFLLGVDLGATPIAQYGGRVLVKSNKMWFVFAGGLFFGFLISVAEPDLQILADQISHFTGGILGRWQIIIIVSIGVGLLIAIGLWRILRRIRLKYVLYITYAIIFILAVFVPPAFHAFAFDASGATTGAITTPFILALAAGVAHVHDGRTKDATDSFGLAGLASAGAIVAVLFRGIFARNMTIGGDIDMPSVSPEGHLLSSFIKIIPRFVREAFLSIAPLIIIFLLMQFFALKLRKRQVVRVLIGLFYCLIGLVIFLVGVTGGFMEVGSLVGIKLAAKGNGLLLFFTGFGLGMLTVLAEPAVPVLSKQVESETSGNIPRKLVLIFLSGGVAISGGLSMLRVLIPGLALWHLLLPGYLIVMLLSIWTPDIFIGVAFDAGGVASGPMTATFILAFAQGAAHEIETADILLDGFGIIALVAMMPLIALQTLGIIYRIRTSRNNKKTLTKGEAND